MVSAHQPAIAFPLRPLGLVELIGDILFANLKEAADANDQRLGLAILGQDDVVHVADVLSIVAGAVVDGFTDDVGGKVAISALHGFGRSRFGRSRRSVLCGGVGRARRGWRSRGRGVGGRRSRIIGLAIEVRLSRQLILCGFGDQPAVAIPFGPLQLVVVESDILGANAKKAADADDDGFRLTVFIEDDITDITDVLGIVACAIIDRFTDDVGYQAALGARNGSRRSCILDCRVLRRRRVVVDCAYSTGRNATLRVRWWLKGCGSS